MKFQLPATTLVVLTIKLLLSCSVEATGDYAFVIHDPPEPPLPPEKAAWLAEHGMAESGKEDDVNRLRHYHRGRSLQSEYYIGSISPGESVTGAIVCPPENNLDSPDLWDYYSLELEAGSTYNVDIARIDCQMDLYAAVYFGVLTGPPTSSGDIPGLTFVGSGDDGDPPPASCPDDSPYGDPNFSVTVATTGTYTLTIQSYLSGTCDGLYEYGISTE